jgi:hypothetical protein
MYEFQGLTISRFLHDMHGHLVSHLSHLLAANEHCLLPHLLYACPRLWSPRWHFPQRCARKSSARGQMPRSSWRFRLRYLSLRMVHSARHSIGLCGFPIGTTQ